MTENREFIGLGDAIERLRQSLWGGRTPDEVLPIPDIGPMWATPDRQTVYADFLSGVRVEKRKLLYALAGREIQSWSADGQETPWTFWNEQIRLAGLESPLAPPINDATQDQIVDKDEFERWLVAAESNPFIRPSDIARRGVLMVLKDLLQTGSVTAHQCRALCIRWKIEADADFEHLILQAERAAAGEFWTVDQALSWILWRDFERLDLDPLSIFVHAIADDEEGALPPRYSLRDANAVLVALLQRGVIRAYAGPRGAVEEIAPVQFADAAVVHREAGHVIAFAAFAGDSMGLDGHFDRLRIVGRDLTREMPPIKPGAPELRSREDGPFASPSPALAWSSFDPAPETMLIGEAALWLAGDGQAFKNSLARADRFYQIGVPRLFAALARGELEASGLNVATRRREPIPADVWLECDLGEGADGKHHFSFIDNIKQNESGGSITLWPYRSKEGPEWCDIRISNSALLSAFSSIEVPAPPRESTVERPGRGRQKGTGKDDSAALAQIRVLMSNGVPKGRAVTQVATSLKNDGTEQSTEKRLLRKLGAGSSR